MELVKFQRQLLQLTLSLRKLFKFIIVAKNLNLRRAEDSLAGYPLRRRQTQGWPQARGHCTHNLNLRGTFRRLARRFILIQPQRVLQLTYLRFLILNLLTLQSILDFLLSFSINFSFLHLAYSHLQLLIFLKHSDYSILNLC